MALPVHYRKGIFFWLVFLLLYLLYKFLGWELLKVICGTTESNFQHYKAAFFSWTIVSLAEYYITGSRQENRTGFVFSRMATATILPWFIFLLWYIAPALYGRLPSIPLEIIYANIITIAAGFAGGIFERGISSARYSAEMKVLIIFLALASLLHYIVFTFAGLPWADVFVEPDWR
jgi:hypothetical protein